MVTDRTKAVRMREQAQTAQIHSFTHSRVCYIDNRLREYY